MTDGGRAKVNVEFRVLGQVEAYRDGAPVALGGPQQRRLLGALLTEPGHAILIDRLVDILWPDDEPPDRARRTLMTYVSRLRLAIGPDLVETVGPGYRLVAPPDSVDAQRFERLLDAASRSSPTHQLVLLGDALALWRGAAFGDLSEEWWARPASGRLDELRRIAREDRAAALLLTSQPDVAVSELEEMVASSPFRERTMLLYLRALSEAGRKIDALRAFQRYRERLAEETGMPPSEALVLLDRSIAGDDADLVVHAGQTLRGYVLHGLLGEGATSQVYRGTQPGLGRDVAIKVIKPGLSDTPVFVERFEVEARIVSQLEHPHIVPLYDFWREPGGAYLVFRWMRGGSLEGLAATSGPWPIERVDVLVDDIGGALSCAHAFGVVHGDVKPANVLLDEAGRCYLADFGIASLCGGNGSRDVAVDQFGLAATIWEILTGLAPFTGIRTYGTSRVSSQEHLPSIRSWRPDITEAVDHVLRTATASDEAERYPSMNAMVAAWHEARGDPAVTGLNAARQTAAERPPRPGNPYQGLKPFAESDTDDFHGRGSLVEELTERISERSFVVVLGASGSGKSSLLHAGLVARLRSSRARVVTTSPGDNLVARLRTALLSVALKDPGPGSVADQLRTIASESSSDLVVVVDQLEEAWDASWEGRSEFLLALTSAPPSVRVVAAMRADRLDQLLSDAVIGPAMRDAAFLMTPMTPAELRLAIEAPAAARGLQLEPALVDQILHDVAGTQGALPMLQFTLRELHARRNGNTMTCESYEALGGVSGAIARRAEEVLTSFDVRHQDAVRRCFERLVSPGLHNDDHFRRVRVSELDDDDGEVVATLVDARLLVADRDPVSREPTVEVAHAALLTHWPRLRGWLDEDRQRLVEHQRLSAAANTWDAAGRSESDLYRGGRLEVAEELLERGGITRASAVERQFLTASRDLATREEQARHRQHRRLRRRLVTIAGLLVLALVAGGLAAVQARAALGARDDAEQEARQARLRALDSAIVDLGATDRSLAALLAVEAHRIEPSADTASTLFSLFTNSPGLLRIQRFDPAASIDAALLMPDDSLLYARDDRSLVRTSISIGTPAGTSPAASPVVVDGTGEGPTISLATTATGDRVARLMSAPDGAERLVVYDVESSRRVLDLTVDASSIAMSADGRFLALAGGANGDVDVRTVDGEEIGVIAGGGHRTERQLASTSAATFGADGTLFVSTQDGSVRTVSLPSLAVTTELRATDASIPATSSLVLSADGATLFGNGFTDPNDVSNAALSSIQAWDVATGAPLWSVDDARECVSIVSIAVDGTVRCAYFFGRITAYSARTGELRPSSQIDTQLGGLVEVAATSSGSLVAVSGVDPTLIEWAADGSGAVTTEIAPRTTPQAFLSRDRLLLFQLGNPSLPYWPPEVVDPGTGEVVDPLDGVGASTPAGLDRIAAVFLDGAIGFYDVDSKVRAVAGDPPRFPTPAAAAYSRAAGLLVVWHVDGTNSTLDDAGSWSSIALPTGLPRSASFSTDGARLLTTEVNQGLSMWDVHTGRRLAGPMSGVLEVGSAQAGVVATADVDGTVVIRRDDDLTPIGAPIRLTGARVQDLQFDENARLLAVRTTDSVHLIDVDGRVVLGGPIATGRPDPDEGLALSPDGTRLAVASSAGTAVWSLDTDDWERAACRQAGRNLTREEWDRFVGPLATYRTTCSQYPVPPRADSASP